MQPALPTSLSFRDALLTLAVMVVWGTNFVVIHIGVEHFPPLLFAALLHWSWFSTALVNASAAVVGNANLIKKVYFPLELLPLVNVTTNLVNYVL